VSLLLDDFWLWRALTHSPDVAGVASSALAGDETARSACFDFACEHWEADVVPFDTEKPYLICTTTLYYLGRVREVRGGFLLLESASWVHWTGRLSTLLSKYKLKGFPSGQQTPRTEYVGEVIVSLGSIVSAYPWAGQLPTESVP
jgi:hypothetical protein